MPSFRGLYYPYIHFQDEGWLKTAALYWDTMTRVVPSGDIRGDSDEVRRLISAGFVGDESPHRAASAVAEPFRQLLLARGDELRERFGITETTPEDELEQIFDAKIDRDVLGPLLELGLARQRKILVSMRPRLANVYMTAIAEAIAPGIGARPVSDDFRDHIAISGLTVQRLAEILLDPPAAAPTHLLPDIEIEQRMATIALRYVVPKNPGTIPAEEIIKFRHEYAEERGAYQAEIAKIVKDLDYVHQMTDAEDIQRLLESEYEKRLAGKVKRLEAAMRHARWDTVDSALAASWAAPAGVSAGLAAAGLPVPAAVMAAVGVAFGAWTIYRKYNKTTGDQLKPSAECYLYRARTALSPHGLMAEFSAGAAQFVPVK